MSLFRPPPAEGTDTSTAIALIRASLAHDNEGFAAILRTSNKAELVGSLVALAESAGATAYGSPEGYDAHLAEVLGILATDSVG